jgi:hypothetical protein
MELQRGSVKVEWVELGEGVSGDYDPTDPDDVELLRFDFYGLGEWRPVLDTSYCTRVSIDTPEKRQKELLELLMEKGAWRKGLRR